VEAPGIELDATAPLSPISRDIVEQTASDVVPQILADETERPHSAPHVNNSSSIRHRLDEALNAALARDEDACLRPLARAAEMLARGKEEEAS
jgi:hypothetical protein